jgi:hypothetical protein
LESIFYVKEQNHVKFEVTMVTKYNEILPGDLGADAVSDTNVYEYYVNQLQWTLVNPD